MYHTFFGGKSLDVQNTTRYNKSRLQERGIDEFIGICKGILFDGTIASAEVINLAKWLNANPEVADHWPCSVVRDAIQPIVAANKNLMPDDEHRLLILLTDLTGNPEAFQHGQNASTQLPLCDPPPSVIFDGTIFVLTGNFKIGNRTYVTELIQSLGGLVLSKDIRLNTDFLVIGNVGSTAWKHSTHGRKIERAVELRDVRKTDIHIISEDHLITALPPFSLDKKGGMGE